MEDLHTAIRRGKLEQVQNVVEEQQHNGALRYIEAADEYGYTALHVASRYGRYGCNADIVQYLVQTCGALVEAMTHEGMTALLLACQAGHLAIVKCLIEVGGARLYTTTPDGSTILHVAAGLDVIQYLVASGANVVATNNDGCRPFHVFCRHNASDIVRYLGSANAVEIDHFGRTAVHHACHNGDIVHLLRYLVRMGGVNVAATDTKGVTALHVACRHSDLQAVRYLVQQDASLVTAVTQDGTTALHLACRYKTLETVQYLVDCLRGNSSNDDNSCHTFIEATNGNDGYTALHFACQRRNHPAVAVLMLQFLVETCGADVTATTSDGTTALHLACSDTYNVSLVQYLAKRENVNVAVLNHKGESALHMACRDGDLAMVRYLIETCGANVADVTLNGSTVLHMACQNRFYGNELVHYLVERNVNATARNQDGKSALHTACLHGDLKMVRYLIETCRANVADIARNGSTMLHLACQNRFRGDELVRYLVQRGCINIMALNREGESATHMQTADHYGDLEIETCHDNVAAVILRGSSILHFAYQNRLNLVEQCGCLVGGKLDDDTLHIGAVAAAAATGAATVDGWTVWHFACQRQFDAFNLVQYLVSTLSRHGGTVGNGGIAKQLGGVTNKARDGSTVLHCICQSDSRQNEKMELVQYLMDNDSIHYSLAGAKSLITVLNINGEVAWDAACRKGHVRLVLYMVQRWKV